MSQVYRSVGVSYNKLSSLPLTTTVCRRARLQIALGRFLSDFRRSSQFLWTRFKELRRVVSIPWATNNNSCPLKRPPCPRSSPWPGLLLILYHCLSLCLLRCLSTFTMRDPSPCPSFCSVGFTDHIDNKCESFFNLLL